jgi:hypothetical protein
LGDFSVEVNFIIVLSDFSDEFFLCCGCIGSVASFCFDCKNKLGFFSCLTGVASAY